jgi:hypothetical protein
MSKSKKDIKAVLERIEAAGIQFSVYAHGGHSVLSVKEVLEYMDNKDAVIAKQRGVDVETWKAYLAFEKSDKRCQANTKKGERCKGYDETRLHHEGVETFVKLGNKCLCWTHRGKE